MDRFNHRTRVAAYLCAASLIAPFAGAQSFNVDFSDINAAPPRPNGIHWIEGGTIMPGPPSSAFGAAANQPGTWNLVTSAGPITLNNLNGVATGVQITTTAQVFDGYGGGHTGDLLRLLDDNFFSDSPTPWSFTISGLSNGVYSFYYYAPTNSLVSTGTFTVNGLAAANVVGDNGTSSDNTPLTQGFNWQLVANVTVSNGTLTVVSTNATGLSGLSGFQLVAVPEPATTALLVTSLLGVMIMARKRRRG